MDKERTVNRNAGCIGSSLHSFFPLWEPNCFGASMQAYNKKPGSVFRKAVVLHRLNT